MAAVRKGPGLRFFWKVHRLILRTTNGRLGQHMGPGKQLLLRTVGRKSGEQRNVGLTYIEDAGRWIVVASNAGEDNDPAWWLNLKSRPQAEIMVGGNTVPVLASEAQEPERSRLYQLFVDQHESYAEYATRTSRVIPVVALTPRS